MKSKLAMGASLWVMALMHPAVAQEVVLDEVVVAGTQAFTARRMPKRRPLC